MKKIALLLLLIVSVTTVRAQEQKSIWERIATGGHVSYVLPMNDFEEHTFSYFLRGYGRYSLGAYLHGEFGLGYGTNSGKDFDGGEYSSYMIPLDWRIVFAPEFHRSIQPYLFAGVGLMYYNNTKDHNSGWRMVLSGKSSEKSGVTGIVPLGAGSMFKINDWWSVDVQAAFNQSLTDNLNNYIDGSPKDAYLTLSAGVTYNHKWYDPDDDRDGLMDSEEESFGTDPNNPDTDGDGLNDNEEINIYKTNPLNGDSDGDKLGDNGEVKQYKTNPLNADSDSDGLSDGDEVNVYKTNPINADSDGDDLNDFAEVKTYMSSPLEKDTDGDKLSDYDEVMTHKTSPIKADTDGDKLSDYDEVKTHKTDPLKTDTDGDSLSDYDEIMTHKTNPLNRDTDGGTVADNEEIKRGSDPLDKNDDVVTVGVALVLEGITFATGKADITPESEATLQKALKTFSLFPEISVEIAGHTDNKGSKASNVKLSQRRADAVRTWLISKGVDKNRVTAKGYGPNKPIADNATEEGRAKNRRIEFIRTK
ncbi:MAG: hypothetical protein AMXMBFR48_24500 [Ignavibacteriales bacterium]